SVISALAPRPPYSSSTRIPKTPCSRKSSTTSHGNSAVLSISAARGAIRSRASVRTSSRISRCSSLSGSSAMPQRLLGRPVVHSLGVVAVRVEDERAVVGRVVVLTKAGRAVVLPSRRERRRVEGVDGRPAGGLEGDVRPRPGRVALGDPEGRLAVPAEARRLPLVHR